jgi:hypothetical protein
MPLLPFVKIFAINVLKKEAHISWVALVGVVDHLSGFTNVGVLYGNRDLMLIVQLLDPTFILLILDSDMFEKKDLVLLGTDTPTATSRTITFVTEGCHTKDLLDLELLIRHEWSSVGVGSYARKAPVCIERNMQRMRG